MTGLQRTDKLITVLIALLAPLLVFAADPPILRTGLSVASAHPGEVVQLSVDVLVPGWFTAPLELPASLPLDGGTARLDDTATHNLNERIDGIAYAGIRRSYRIIAQTAGSLDLPAFTVAVHYSNGSEPLDARLQVPAHQLRIALPAGAESQGYFFSTPHFVLQQKVDPAPKRRAEYQVGDVITRTLTQTASGLPAMYLPALSFAPIDGLRIYTDAPQLKDIPGQRGAESTAIRIDRVRYVILRAGQFNLPGVRIGWFNSAQQRMRWARLSDTRFEVAPMVGLPPDTGATATAPPPAANMAQSWQLLVTLLIAAGLLVRLGPPFFRLVRRWKEDRQHSETGRFRTVLGRAAHQLPAALYYEALAGWLRALAATSGHNLPTDPCEFTRRYGSPRLQNDLQILRGLAFAQQTAVNAKTPLLSSSALRQARRRALTISGRMMTAPLSTQINPPLFRRDQHD
jgi:hypothetical protein